MNNKKRRGKDLKKTILVFSTLLAPIMGVIACGNNNTPKDILHNSQAQDKTQETVEPKDTETKAGVQEAKTKSVILPREKTIEYAYKDSSSLKYNDSWWSLDNLSYKKEANTSDAKMYYTNLDLVNGKYPQFNIEDWINVYDTNVENVLSDPKWTYGSDSPNSYQATNKGFINIYHHDGTLGKTKTGNNNNGLNGLYSGANFVIDKDNKTRTFDISTVETLDNLYFDPDMGIYNGWEHVSPQSQTRRVWGRSGVITDKANGDLHNIRPSIQYLFNQPRLNYAFGIVQGNTNSYGVDFEIGNSSFDYKVVEPRVNVRGDIARIMFYMHDRYHITYDLDYYKQLALWAAMDPVTDEEKALDQKIAKVMGFSNDYVTGKKMIPYYEDIKTKVEQANKDTSLNEKSWKIVGPKQFTKEIKTLNDAKGLDWNQSKDIPYGTEPSKDTNLKNWWTNQIILKVIMEDDSTKYFRIIGVESKTIWAKDLETNLESEIATNDDKNNSKRLKTNLGAGTYVRFNSMKDLIKEIKYLIVK